MLTMNSPSVLPDTGPDNGIISFLFVRLQAFQRRKARWDGLGSTSPYFSELNTTHLTLRTNPYLTLPQNNVQVLHSYLESK